MRGFTLIEVLIVIGLSAILFSVGSLVSFDAYRGILLIEESNSLKTLLQKARSEAITNLNNSSHTLQIEDEYFLS